MILAAHRNSRAMIPCTAALVLLAMSCGLAVFAQTASAPPPQQNIPSGALQARSNLVLVRVIVRDDKGNPVTSLTQNDFKLFDNKKQQVISYFRPEVPGQTAGPVSRAYAGVSSATSQPPSAASPQRFTALFFDDYHISFGNLVQVREAAKKYLEENLDAGARVAIVTASGKPELPFTTDRAKLDQALSELRINNRFEAGMCPKLPPYFAQLALDDVPDAMPASSGGGAGGSASRRQSMQQQTQLTVTGITQNRPLKLAEAIAGEENCPAVGPIPDEDMRSRIRDIVLQNELSVQETLIGLHNLVQRMAETPGDRRTIALVSDGFMFKDLQYRMDALIDGALRENVIVNVLDSRGLYAEVPGGDPSLPALPPVIQDQIDNMQRMSMRRDGEILSEIADGTGGVFVQNTNDMNAGIAKIAGLNTPSYLLGFSPESYKLDGRFHSLKVKLTASSHFSLQARRAYFTPNQKSDAAGQDAMEAAIFSQEDMRGLPIQVSTKFAKADANTDKLTVTVDADMHLVQFRKEGNLDADDVTALVVVFDQDGNFITARQQTVKLRLAEVALDQLKRTGGETDIDIPIRPGNYMIRAVLRESDSNQLGAATMEVKVP